MFSGITVSESEKYEVQGRAYAELKIAESNAATIRISLIAYSERLKGFDSFLKQFLSDPLAVGSIKALIADHIKADYRNLVSSSLESNVDELVKETKRIAELKTLIAKF